MKTRKNEVISNERLVDCTLFRCAISSCTIKRCTLNRCTIYLCRLDGCTVNRFAFEHCAFDRCKLGDEPIVAVWQSLTWQVIATRTRIRIGCEEHTRKRWAAFTDARIEKMHLDALDWWRENKNRVLSLGLQESKNK